MQIHGNPKSIKQLTQTYWENHAVLCPVTSCDTQIFWRRLGTSPWTRAMASMHIGSWSGLPMRSSDNALRKKREARDKALVAEVAALDERPKSRETLIRWNLSPAGRVLPPPWALQRNDATADLEVTNVQRAVDDRETVESPKMWDREMLQLCSATGRAALRGSLRDGRGRAKGLVEPYVPLQPPKAVLEKPPNLYHHQLPSPARDRGSGFHPQNHRGTVRFNLQLDGRRPFLPSAQGRMFREPTFLPRGEDLAHWDKERIIAPERAYRASERGSSKFYDERRNQLPAWKPAGSKVLRHGDLSRVGATLMRGAGVPR
eukprot:s2610_g1.t1